MKIIYLHHSLTQSRGMERVLVNKANYWVDKYGYEVIIITLCQDGKPSFYPLNNKVKLIDLNIHFNHGSSVFSKIKYHQQKRGYRKKLENILLQEKANIVVSMYGPEKSFLPKIKDGSKKILEFHMSRYYLQKISNTSNKLSQFISYILQLREQYKIKAFDRFIVLTEEDSTDWKDMKNIHVITNSLSFKPEFASPLTCKRVICIGALNEEHKNFHAIISAWKFIHDKFRDWELTIIGKGEDYDYLIEQIRHSELEECIKILPPTPNIQEEYMNSSIYVMTSHYEGLPMVLLEAESFGLPLVAFACKCGPREIIKDGYNGFLIENENIEQLAERICLLIQDEKLRKQIGKNAAIDSERFSEERIMSQWNELFLNLLNK